MPSYIFSKLVPGGNPTAILHEPQLAPPALAELSARLMDPLCLGVEQAGALYPGGDRPGAALARLEMMGGEFCVNAARAAAMLLAGQGRLAPLAGSGTDLRGGPIRVSGMDEAVFVLAARSEASLMGAVLNQARARERKASDTLPESEWALPGQILYCAARMRYAGSADSCRPAHNGAWRVDMPGMTHVLIDTAKHPLPDLASPAVWRKESAAWRTICGLTAAPASGVVWFAADEEAVRIWPAVAVAATDTEHLESACGSASLAVALLRQSRGAVGPAFTKVAQPSGESLHVFVESAPAGSNSVSAWVAGPVELVAEGTVHMRPV